MHSTWAVPTWREGNSLHPVQVAKEGRTGGGAGSWGKGNETGGHSLDNRHPQRKGGGEDQMNGSFTDERLLS